MFIASYDIPIKFAKSTRTITQTLKTKSINSNPEFPILL